MAEATEPTALHSNGTSEWPAPGGGFARVFRPRWYPLFVVAGLALGAGFVRLCLHYHVPLPFCLLRQTTGIPCPACGSTRSLLAWAHLDPVAALRFNPLFFVITVGVALWAGATLADRFLGTRWLDRFQAVRSRWSATSIIVVLAALNWLYLCLTLPE